MDRRDDDRLPYGRHRRTAASALAAIVVAFAVGALLNAPAMKRTAEELPFGKQRSLRLALVDPLATISHWVLLDRPARLTAAMLGRPDPGPTPVRVVVVKPQATPRGKPKPAASEKPLRHPYPGHPLHLYIAGDSMAGIPGMALVNLSRPTHLIKPMLDYRISSGLCRPDFFNWPAQLQQQAKAFHPGAVVVMFGANDRQGVETSSGNVYQFGTKGWEKEYRHRVRDVIAILFDAGTKRLYWVGQPIMPDATFSRQIRTLNEIYRSEAARHPGVEYIDAYAVFSTSGGGYAQYLKDDHGDLEQVREVDGEHLTYAGGMRLAKVVMGAIRRDWLTKSTKPPAKPPAKPTTGPSPTASPRSSPSP